MKNKLQITICFLLCLVVSHQVSRAQCTFQTLNSDGFEYTTPIPDLQPGVSVHSSPMATGFASGYVAYAGTYAMYLNFVDCNGGLGTCVGAKVYERSYTVCPGMPVRIRAWMTTMFSGANYLQSDLKLVIRDANGLLLDSVPSLVCPFRSAGGWIEYISDTVVSNTSNIVFSMYTNVDGGQGNDLTVDNLRLEGCVRNGSTQVTAICPNQNTLNLYTKLPLNSVSTGTWTGPSQLGGGYQGTYTLGTNTAGNYYYTSFPYSTNAGCPQRVDTVIALNGTSPSLSLNTADTSICTWQTLNITASATGGSLYQWNTGATASAITASTTGSTPTSNTYVVTVTNSTGCTATDSVTVSFILCSGLSEQTDGISFELMPNPAKDVLTVKLNDQLTGELEFQLIDATGRLLKRQALIAGTNTVSLQHLSSGRYQAILLVDGKPVGRQGLVIR
jgi:hypothetical protein